MCLTCGCGRPNDDHGNRDNITLDDLQDAADACGCTLKQAANNFVSTLDVDTSAEDDWGNPIVRGTYESPELQALLRAEPVKKYTLAVAWGLDPDKRPAADGHRVIITPDVLERTAWDFMRKRKVGLYHQDGTEGHGEVVESYIYRGPDWELVDTQGTTRIIRAGFWLVGNVWDDSAWSLVQRGFLDGLSPQGSATFKKSAS